MDKVIIDGVDVSECAYHRMNNYEKIKAMTLDEMALYLISYELYQILKNKPLKYKNIKRWLQQESEGRDERF